MTHSFSIREAFKFGWHTLKTHSVLIYEVLLTLFAVQVAQSIVAKVLQGTALGALANLILIVAGIVIGVGATLITLKLAKGEHATYAHIVPPARTVLYYFVASALAGFITVIPMCIAVIISMAAGASLVTSWQPFVINSAGAPAAIAVVIVAMLIGFASSLYLALRFFFVKLAILEKLDIMASLRKSARMTHGIKGKLILFLLALIAINILGAIALLVGLLISIPVSMLAFARVYTHLESR